MRKGVQKFIMWFIVVLVIAIIGLAFFYLLTIGQIQEIIKRIITGKP